MDVEYTESKHVRLEESHQEESPAREYMEGAYGDLEEDEREKSSKHRSKDRKKGRREEKDYRGRDRDRLKDSDKDAEKQRPSTRDKRKEDREEQEKDRSRDRVREKDYDRDKFREKEHENDKDKRDRTKDRGRGMERETEKESDRGRENGRGKEKSGEKEKERDNEKGKDRDRARDRGKLRDREKEKDQDHVKDRDLGDRDKGKEKKREKEREADQDKETSKDVEKHRRRNRDDGHHRSKDGGKEDSLKTEGEDNREEVVVHHKTSTSQGRDVSMIEHERYHNSVSDNHNQGISEIEERILKMKEERLKKKSESASEILSWVNKSRKIGEKRNVEKEKALRQSKVFEEQDNIEEDDSGDEAGRQTTADGLAGVKVLHGLDKVMEGGSVVLTLKDQEILANGDINEDLDMLENVEIGEQKQRDVAYKAAKKKTGLYDDKFNDEAGSEKKMLPQYDEPSAVEGVTLDASGRIAGEAQRKLEELRKRLQGASVNNEVQDLNSYVKVASDYYTHEEMLKFKKPKKKKSLRKKEKLDLDALEAEARSAGLGAGDLGSRNDAQRQAAKEEQEKSEARRRKDAYEAAYAKAEEASRALRMEQTLAVKNEEDDVEVFADDAEDLQKALERARKLAFKKHNKDEVAGPEAIARFANSDTNSQQTDSQNPATGEASENQVVFTEMEEFVWGLQLDEEAQKPETEDVFMEEDEEPKAPEQDTNKEETAGGWTEVNDPENDVQPKDEDQTETIPDSTIHEAPVGKGLSGALKLLKERGSLKETVEWGGRNMDKKKSKLVGIYDEGGTKEINIERTDEYGRILTPKESFRLISHKFHGKGPGKMKQEKRMKQYQDELKLKQMKNNDTPSQSVDRMREAHAQLKTPYLVISGNVKPGQTSNPRSGFATVEKDLPGGLTPMLGDKKVENFLGIKRKADAGIFGMPKKPKI